MHFRCSPSEQMRRFQIGADQRLIAIRDFVPHEFERVMRVNPWRVLAFAVSKHSIEKRAEGIESVCPGIALIADKRLQNAGSHGFSMGAAIFESSQNSGRVFESAIGQEF